MGMGGTERWARRARQSGGMGMGRHSGGHGGLPGAPPLPPHHSRRSLFSHRPLETIYCFYSNFK